MRYFISVLVALILAGCAQGDFVRYPGYESTVAFDFSPYAEKGFLFTPQGYNGDYESVGQITMTIWPEVNERANLGIAEDRASESDSTYADGVFVVEELTTDAPIRNAYEEARDMGADAIVNFDVTPMNRTISAGRSDGEVTIVGYEVRGFAINRK
jgi:hypothetical protein